MKNYDGFISYAHGDCSSIAPRIQKHLENLGKPWYQLKRHQSIYRDETNLTVTPELWTSIQGAIRGSENMVLLATPLSAQSEWVENEVNEWYEGKSADKNQSGQIYIALLEGEIAWNDQLNDFDWQKTTAISKNSFTQKFKSEPFWIDLKPYVTKRDQEITLTKSDRRGFVLKLTKIVAGMLNKEPREIESDELRRSRRIGSVLSLASIAFVALVITAFFLYRQSSFEKKVSFSTSLISKGNSNSQKNISKALNYYYYAYLINPTEGNFKILNDFYEQNVVRELETISLYFQEIGETVKYRSTLSAIWGTYYSSGHIIYLGSDTLQHFNLETHDFRTQVLDIPDYRSVSVMPDNEVMYFLRVEKEDTIHPLLSTYNLRTNETEILDISMPTAFFESESIYYWGCQLSKNSEYLIIYPDGDMDFGSEVIQLPLFVLNLATLELSSHQLEFNAIGNDEIKDCQIHDSGRYVYLKHGNTYEGADLQNSNFIFDLTTNKIIKEISNGEDGYSWYIDELKSFEWGGSDFFYIGNNGGGIMGHGFEEFEVEISSFPNGQPPSSEITSIWIDSDFVITGTVNGVVTFWTNSFEDEDMSFDGPGFESRYGSVKLPTLGGDNSYSHGAVAIDEIYLDRAKKELIVSNYNGNVYSIDISNKLRLSKDPEILKTQIKSLKINDLSKEEKLKYELNDL